MIKWAYSVHTFFKWLFLLKINGLEGSICFTFLIMYLWGIPNTLLEPCILHMTSNNWIYADVNQFWLLDPKIQYPSMFSPNSTLQGVLVIMVIITIDHTWSTDQRLRSEYNVIYTF